MLDDFTFNNWKYQRLWICLNEEGKIPNKILGKSALDTVKFIEEEKKLGYVKKEILTN